jgi:hypothetical protein
MTHASAADVAALELLAVEIQLSRATSLRKHERRHHAAAAWDLGELPQDDLAQIPGRAASLDHAAI